MKKAFSLLEIIIVIVIIGILASVSINKLFFSLDSAHLLQVKTEINIIKNAIVKKSNKEILLGKNFVLNRLDDTPINTKGELLFSAVLTRPIISTNEREKTVSKWIKLSNNQYKIYISNEESIIFDYDSTALSFDCDFKTSLCKELYQ